MKLNEHETEEREWKEQAERMSSSPKQWHKSILEIGQ